MGMDRIPLVPPKNCSVRRSKSRNGSNRMTAMPLPPVLVAGVWSGCLLGDHLLGPAGQGGWWDRPDLPGDLAAVAQEHQGGDPPDPEALGRLRRLVDVHLDRLQAPGQRPGRLLDAGLDDPAGPAPRCPQVDQHRQRGAAGDLLEVAVMGRRQPGEGRVAGRAARHPTGGGRDPVAPPAVRAGDDVGHAQAASRVSGGFSQVITSSSPLASTRTPAPSRTSPPSRARPMRVSTSWEMNRRSGRAPYTGSNPWA